MAGFIDTLEQQILDHVLNDGAYTPPANWFIGLSTTTPTDAGANFTEPVGGSYARVQTTAADWGPASGTAPAVKSNSAVKTFPTATAAWGSVTHWGLFAALSGGTVQIWGVLTTPRTVSSTDTASFAAGACVIQLGDPSDVF